MFKHPKYNVIIILFGFFSSLLFANSSFGQVPNECEDIVYKPDTFARYRNNTNELLDYFSTNITPIIENFCKKQNKIISKYYIELYIDKKGNVFNSNIKRPELPEEYCEKIKKELLKMNGWFPATDNNQTVCSYLQIPITICWK